MKTDLPVGTYFRFIYRGNYDFGRVTEHDEPNGKSIGYQLLSEKQVPTDAIVHNCVWKEKGTSLVSKGICKNWRDNDKNRKFQKDMTQQEIENSKETYNKFKELIGFLK